MNSRDFQPRADAGLRPAPGALSRREEEVARAYAAGASYKEIARDLGVSPTTVRSHNQVFTEFVKTVLFKFFRRRVRRRR